MASGNGTMRGERTAAVQVCQMTRWFGSTLAVDRLDFEIFAGEVVGFIGPNGAGKTTTMRILATLDEPNSGDAFVEGFSVINDPDLVRRRLGYMPDTYGSYQNVSCNEYLDFFARSYRMKGDERREAIGRVIDFTRMGQMVNMPVNGLSKGMKQRLCLGRALIHDPQVLVLDEPAAGLDPRARIELKEMISQLAAAGKSLLISSHILTELAEMCHRVVIIERGRLLGNGTVDEIMRGAFGEGDSPRSSQIVLELESLDPPAALIDWLSQRRGISASASGSEMVQLPFSTDRELQAELLRELIDAGFRVNRFQPRRRSLEEAFLHVTRGEVQ
jgi:ABC-2 type transport system ATP-binding protein